MRNKVGFITGLLMLSLIGKSADAHTSSSHGKDRLDRSFSSIVKSHWNVSHTGTLYKIKAKFTVGDKGVAKIESMENVLGNTVITTDNPHEVDPALGISIAKAIKLGSEEYAANGHPRGANYIGWFITAPHDTHKVRISLIN
ncbi:MAG: hypothetical protein U0103_29720 [Candidatus Obscuribacterales bacterium]